jgi:ligand-binding SRPBCC domain-containing protein
VKFETTVEIDAPLERVWRTLVDVDRWPELTESIDEVKWLDGMEVAKGNRIRIKQPGLPAGVWEVTEFEPTASFAWQTVSPGVTTVATHAISEAGAGRVAVTFGIRQSGPLAPLVGLIAGSRTRRYVNMEAAGIKQRAEASSGS